MALLKLAGAGLVLSAVANTFLARKAERENPPVGRFLDIDGVRLHYVERGQGTPLVLLHGNGSMIQDFEASGLIDRAAETCRVVVFDRPGYGHSDRPRGRSWTPEAQADLIRQALARLGIDRAVVLGHSWGCLVAVALADRHPETVAGLVLASGYYYPTPRVDVAVMAAPAVPVLGDVLRHTLSPLVSRLIWPLLMRKIFGPEPMPGKFAGFPKAMAVRPSQLRASAEESAMMIPEAGAARDSYARLRMPVAIVTGTEDRLVDPEVQSARLHADIAHSSLRRVPGGGHMIHQTATDAVLAAVGDIVRPKR